MADSDTKVRAIRITDELWTKAMARAHERGETVSQAVRKFLMEYTK